MSTTKEEREQRSVKLAGYYADYIREHHIEPSTKGFNAYLNEKGVLEHLSGKEWSKIRELAYSKNEDLQDFSLNESDFTDEYYNKLENVLSTCKKFIITTAVTGKAAKVEFYNALLNWANHNDGNILILPSADVKSSKTVFKMNFDPIFKNDRTWFILNRDGQDDNTISTDETPDGYYLNKHLWLSCVKTQAKTVKPISGYNELITSKDASIIVGHPRQHLYYNAALKHKIPRAVMSTGACTVNNYKTDLAMCGKTSSKAKESHQFAAVIVEIKDENIFHFRQVQSIDGTSFTDLDTIYYSDGTTEATYGTTLVMGDSHAGATDNKLMKAIMQQLVAFNVIDEIVLHDLCDARPISPHDTNKLMTRIDKVNNDKNRLMQNFEDIVKYLNDITTFNVNVVVVASNHDEHLVKALENLPAILGGDDINAETMIRMAAYYCSNQHGSLLKFCVETLPKAKLNHPERIRWLVTDESYERYGCELGQHGHLGANGSRGNATQYEKYVGNAVIGHSHSARITGRTFQVGATCDLDQGYNKGLSSWTRTCCLVHKDGTKQLINFIPDSNGEYSFRNDMKEF